MDFLPWRRWRPSFHTSSVTMLYLLIKIKLFSWQIDLSKKLVCLTFIQMKVFSTYIVMKWVRDLLYDHDKDFLDFQWLWQYLWDLIFVRYIIASTLNDDTVEPFVIADIFSRNQLNLSQTLIANPLYSRHFYRRHPL